MKKFGKVDLRSCFENRNQYIYFSIKYWVLVITLLGSFSTIHNPRELIPTNGGDFVCSLRVEGSGDTDYGNKK